MTFFDFIVPVIALAVAGGGILFARYSARRFDAQQGRDHPAE